MASFEITMSDHSTQRIDEAEAYQLEGPMTTFFITEGGRGRLDSWATRLASFRSADVVMIRRVDERAHLVTLPSPDQRPRLDLVLAAEA